MEIKFISTNNEKYVITDMHIEHNLSLILFYFILGSLTLILLKRL